MAESEAPLFSKSKDSWNRSDLDGSLERKPVSSPSNGTVLGEAMPLVVESELRSMLDGAKRPRHFHAQLLSHHSKSQRY